jgi:hypothetical protein
MEFKELQTELKIVGQFMANILVAEIVAKGKVASGGLRDSVEYRIVRTPNSYAVELYAAGYIFPVSEGWKQNELIDSEGEFLRSLTRWVLIKSKESNEKAARQAAWAIRNAIFERGIPATNIIEFAIKEIEKNIDEMVRQSITKDIEDYFDNLILN